MSDTYADVDRAAAPAEQVASQQRMEAWPAVAAYKRRTHELLVPPAGAAAGPPVGPPVDVGCGPGGDVLAEWDAAMRAGAPGVVYAVTFVVCSGRVPAG